MLESGGEASSVVIETTEVTVDGNRAVVATAMPTMGRLRYQALQSGTASRLTVVLATLMRLPLLLAMAIVAMLFAAGAGFILFLIWIFLTRPTRKAVMRRAAGTAASRAAALLRHSRSSSSGIGVGDDAGARLHAGGAVVPTNIVRMAIAVSRLPLQST